MSSTNLKEINQNNQNEPLDDESLKVKEYFKQFIRNKSIEELIAYDNKIFSEVRNLESEKHVLVTQNYKKFVAATETINTIKSSLVGFEKDLLTLQGKVQNLVSNYNTVNSSIEDKLKETQNIYRIKKDLKRLKFISDLPFILENQLNEYLSLNEKGTNIKLLAKSLSYYEKCKEFLHMHKENSLVKDIYSRTSSLVYKYRNLIYDEMHIPDFNELNLEHFEVCLSLLVKIEEDQTELVTTFIDRYKYLISKKFDDIFSMREGVSEIDYFLYGKIYDNYEFAINENEFLFYEDQITREESSSSRNINLNVNISSLSSKFFKKGTFIWICKKIQEVILSQFIPSAYKTFKNIFDKKHVTNLSMLLLHILEVFKKKLKDLLDKCLRTKIQIDPTFFSEGLNAFYTCYHFEVFNKMNDEHLSTNELFLSMQEDKKSLSMMFITNLKNVFNTQVCELVKNSLSVITNQSVGTNSNSNHKFYFDKQIYLGEANSVYNHILSLLQENMALLKKVKLDEDTDRSYMKQILNFVGIVFLIMKSCNKLKFNAPNKLKDFLDSDMSDEKFNSFKLKINENLHEPSKERIYLMLTLCKLMNSNALVKSIRDKLLREFPNIKNNKVLSTEMRSSLEKGLSDSMGFLLDSIVQLTDSRINDNLKSLFYDVDWLQHEDTVTFRLPLRDLCYDLYQLKTELFSLLEEEGKVYQELKSSSFQEALMSGNKKKRLTKVQKEMECLHIRRLTIYDIASIESPQSIMYTLSKIFLKVCNEFVKMKKFSNPAYQQVQLDINFVKSFFREFLVIDIENILDGFFFEIIKNCSFNTINPTSFNEELIADMIALHSKEFKGIIASTDK